jgi:hypothetical protein
VLRGLLLGLFAFAGFFFVLALSIERRRHRSSLRRRDRRRLVLQAGALWVMRREARPR